LGICLQEEFLFTSNGEDLWPPKFTRSQFTWRAEDIRTKSLIMAISSNFPYAKEPSTTSHNTSANGRYMNARATNMAAPKSSSDSTSSKTQVDNTADFEGEVSTNNNLPTQNDLKRLENFNVLDQDGKPVPFKNLYSGPNVAKRVLIIFIRHFFCGVRTLHFSSTHYPAARK
jgi:hypothetical protein